MQPRETSGPLSTGQLAALLGVPPYRVSNLLFQKKVEPPQIMGRSAFYREDARKAARLIGVVDPARLNAVELLQGQPDQAAGAAEKGGAKGHDGAE
ncbi:MAG: hypothetical protein ABSE73_09010 [Planctomycetota bacterium]